MKVDDVMSRTVRNWPDGDIRENHTWKAKRPSMRFLFKRNFAKRNRQYGTKHLLDGLADIELYASHSCKSVG